MLNQRQLSRAAILVVIYLAASGALIANAQEVVPRPVRQHTAQLAATPDQPMMMVNKCSKLLGAKVENPAGEVLGKIDEVVVDFDNGWVSYCAMKIKGGALGRPTYVAVPLAAFRPSADGFHVILDSDRNKLSHARAFDRNNWPPMNNPAWEPQPPGRGAPLTAQPLPDK